MWRYGAGGFHWLGTEIPTVQEVWYQSNTGREWTKTTNYGHYFVWKMCLLFVLNNSTAEKENILVTYFVSGRAWRRKRHRRREQTKQSIYFCWWRDCLNKTLLTVAIRYRVYSRAFAYSVYWAATPWLILRVSLRGGRGYYYLSCTDDPQMGRNCWKLPELGTGDCAGWGLGMKAQFLVAFEKN